MLELLTLESFSPAVGGTVKIQNQEFSGEFELVEAKHSKFEGTGERKPFALLFKSMNDDSFPQGTYEVTLPDQEEPIEMFLSAVFTGEKGHFLEAIFS